MLLNVGSVAEMRFIKMDSKVEKLLKDRVTPIDEKTRENRLKQFAYVQVRAINTPVRKNELIQVKGKEKRKSKTKNNISKSSKKCHQLRK